jgi:PAS domain S-box-containing protein
MQPVSGRQEKSPPSAVSWKNVLAALLVTGLVGLSLYSGLNSFVLSQAEESIASILLSHKGIHHYIQRNTHPSLYQLQREGEVPEDFYSPELLSSSFMLRNIHSYYNEERAKAGLPPIYYKMAAFNPRNPVNQADELERRLIEMFNQDRQMTHYNQVIELDGKKYLYYALPFLANNEACLKCHGPRQDAPRQLQERYPGEGGFNEHLGDIRAIEFVRAPLESQFKSLHLMFAALLAGLTALILLVLFSHRLRAVVRVRTLDLEKELDERQRAERSLRESEDRYRSLFEMSPDVVVVHIDERVVFVNPAGVTLLGGRNAQEILGRNLFDDFVVAEQRDLARGHARDILENDSAGSPTEYRFQRLDGSTIDVGAKGARIQFGGQRAVLSICRDLTERKKAEEEKNRLLSQLHQVQKMEAIGTLAGGIAHDFNNILAAVLGYTELAQEIGKSRQDNSPQLAQVLRATERARTLVQQILAFSRKTEINSCPLNLNKHVAHVLELLERTLPKMVGMETRLDARLRSISADPTQMEQVLMNLAINAADAVGEGEGGQVVIETRNFTPDDLFSAKYPEVNAGEYVLLRVTDTGQGMDQATVERIFEPFFTTKEVGKGTGLGLSTVYGIVKSHGGYIHCQSQPGQGTTFEVLLPALKTEARELAPEAAEATDLPRGSESILLVDDEEAIRELGSRVLAKYGYQVRTAQGGEEALEIYRAMGGQLDLLVMALGMPGMGGHKALQAILAINPRAKVVIASGYAADAQVKAALQAGAAAYVAKPYRRADLLFAVRSVLDGK